MIPGAGNWTGVIDITSGMTGTDPYIGVYTFRNVTVQNYARATTDDCVLASTTVDATSAFTTGACP